MKKKALDLKSQPFGGILPAALVSVLGRFLIITVIFLLFFITTPTFRSYSNLIQICLAAAIYVIVSMGITHVIITGNTDLSAGSVVGLSGVVCCLLLRDYHTSILTAVLGGLLIGAVCGVVNGLLVTKLKLVPFIATLGTQWVFRGFVFILGDGMPVSVRDAITEGVAERFYFLGGGRLFGIPVPIYIFTVLGIILAFFLKRSVFGRNLYAVGSNRETAALSGINVNHTVMYAYIICDVMAALGGIMLAAKLVSAQTNAGQSYEFEGIFAAVIGGASLRGGEGSIFGSVIGAFIVAILRNGLNLNGVNAYWQQVILGAIIIFVVYLDIRRTGRAAGK